MNIYYRPGRYDYFMIEVFNKTFTIIVYESSSRWLEHLVTLLLPVATVNLLLRIHRVEPEEITSDIDWSRIIISLPALLVWFTLINWFL